MLRKSLSLLIIGVVQISGLAVFARTKPEKEFLRTEKIRAAIRSLGTGPQTRVKVKLKDQTTLAGSIKEADGNQFVVTDLKNAKDTPVAYPQVQTVHGQNLNTGEKIAIGAAIGVGVTLIVLYLLLRGHG